MGGLGVGVEALHHIGYKGSGFHSDAVDQVEEEVGVPDRPEMIDGHIRSQEFGLLKTVYRGGKPWPILIGGLFQGLFEPTVFSREQKADTTNHMSALIEISRS